MEGATRTIWRCTTALIQRDRDRERERELIQVVIAGPSSAISSFSFLWSHHITVCINTFSHSLYLSHLSQLIIKRKHTFIHIVVSGSAAVSSEGEIGDTPISELLSGGRNREGGRERDTGERVGDENVQNSRTMFCTPCAVESEVVIEVEGDDADGILESHQIVPVDDRTGALSFNQKGVVMCECACVRVCVCEGVCVCVCVWCVCVCVCVCVCGVCVCVCVCCISTLLVTVPFLRCVVWCGVMCCDRLSNLNLCMHFNIQNYLPPSPLLSLTSPQSFYSHLPFTQYLISDLTGIYDRIDIFLTSHSSATVHTALRTATGRRRPERYGSSRLCSLLCRASLIPYLLLTS